MVHTYYKDKLYTLILENHRVRELAIAFIKEFLLYTKDGYIIFPNEGMRTPSKIIQKIFIDKYDGDKVKADVIYLNENKDTYYTSTINTINLSILEPYDLINIYSSIGDITFGNL